MTRRGLWWVPLLLLAAPAFGRMPLHRDLADYFLPMRAHTRELLASGQGAWLNPMNGCGEPWLANPQTGVLSPIHRTLALLPVEWGLTAEVALHLAVLSLGVGALARTWGAGRRGVLLSQTVAWSCGPILSMVGLVTNLETLAWLPWMTVAALRAGPAGVGLTAVATALAWLGGEPQLWATGVGLAAAAAGFRRGALLGLALGAALCAAQMVPFVQWVLAGDRGPAAADWVLPGALPPRDLLGLVAPLPSSGTDGMVYVEALYVGAPVLCCALLGLRRRRVAAAVVAGLVVVAMLPALGLDAVYLFLTRGLVRFPSRLMVLAAAILLPGIGVGLRPWLAGRGRFLALGLGGAGLVASALVHDPAGRGLGALAGGITMLTALPSAGRRLRWLALAVGLLPAAVLVPGLLELRLPPTGDLATTPWPEARDGGRLYSPPPTRSDLQEVSERPLQRRHRPMGYLNLVQGIVSVRSPAPVVDRRLVDHLDHADAGPSGRWWLDTLAIRWAVLQVEGPPPSTMETVRSEGGFTLFRNLSASGLIRLAETIPDPRTASRSPGGLATLRSSATRLEARTSCSRGVWLWLSVPAGPGWRWRIDGRDVLLDRGPGALQAVHLEPGQHHLSGTYRPPLRMAATAASLVGLIAAAGLLTWSCVFPKGPARAIVPGPLE